MSKVRCPHCKTLNHAEVEMMSYNGSSVPVVLNTIQGGDPANRVTLNQNIVAKLYSCLRCGTVFIGPKDVEAINEAQEAALCALANEE